MKSVLRQGGLGWPNWQVIRAGARIKSLNFDEAQISDSATLNRGINQTQETLTDKTTGGLDVHAKADLRLLTDTVTYVKESKDNVRNFGTNTPKAWERIKTGVGDDLAIGSSVITGQTNFGEGFDVFANTKAGKLRDQKEKEAQNSAYANSVNHLIASDTNANRVKNILKIDVDSTTTTLGGSNKNADGTERQTFVYDQINGNQQTMMTPEGKIIDKSDTAGMTETKTKDIGFNLNHSDLQDGTKVMANTTHEAAHRVGYGEGMADVLGAVASDAWGKANLDNNRTTGPIGTPAEAATAQANWVANQNTNLMTNSSSQSSVVLMQGNDHASSVTEGQPSIIADKLLADTHVNKNLPAAPQTREQNLKQINHTLNNYETNVQNRIAKTTEKALQAGYNSGALFINSNAPELISYGVVYAGPLAVVAAPYLAAPVSNMYGPALQIINAKDQVPAGMQLPFWGGSLVK